ncbi:MAG TPA: adenylate/guanylate cyclase domain-containing protein [Solirubrobacterales bacterium]|nr:adenylate/guanylate cyclase domain-containing protein [Solirubrobacterales bacterium]
MVDPRDDAERKQVTVLFADVNGSMDLAEQQDPEEWRKIMQRFYSLLADAVDHYQGTVDKFTGDGIMAVFGAPVAHEDHAQRACYAALRMLDDTAEYAAELRRGLGLNFSARIGINSGEVVAGAIGAGGGEYTAIGHTVGLAQRMESLAEPGRAYLTEHTAALVEGFLALDDLGEFEIKGSSQPVRVSRLEGVGTARSRIDLSRDRGFTRFVGRREEMTELQRALAKAASGDGGAVGIVAEPGVGKSRLCHEFAEHCRREGYEVFEAQAQAHGTSSPYLPVLQMLRSFFAIGDADPDQQVREKIAGRTLLLGPELVGELPLLFEFLGVPDADRSLPQLSADARQRALTDLVCGIVNAPKRDRTLVLVVEDLHWIDPGSEAMMATLLETIAATNTLLVVNYRPEYEPGWRGAPIYSTLSLTPLEQADTSELLRHLAGTDPSLDGLDEPVHERTQGNPFFIEELVRELAECGHLEGERGAYRLVRPIDDHGVPVTVQAVLAARIDRLSPEAKQLLQVASVVGKEIGAEALGLTAGLDADQLDPVVRELVGAGFLYEAELYPRRVLAFRHPLTREVAYGTQLAESRADTHAAAARAMIELEPDRHDELAALIAGHMEAGEELREAARWSARAAYWAGHRRPTDALRLWQDVTRLAEQLEDDDEKAALALSSRLQQLDFSWRLGMDPAEADALAAEAKEIADRTGDLRSLSLLKLMTSARPGVSRRASEWIASAHEAIALADEAGDLDLRIAIRSVGAYAQMCAGDLDAVDAVLDEIFELTGDNIEAGANIVITCPYSWALMARSIVLKERDRLEEADSVASKALHVAASFGDPETESWARGNRATMLAERGMVEAGLSQAQRNCELTDRLGDVFSRAVALTGLGLVQTLAGEHAAALETLDLAEDVYREAMNTGGEQEAWRGTLKAWALLGLGRDEEALALAERVTAIAREREMNWQLPSALLALGQARRANGSDGVDEAFDEATALCERLGHMQTLRKIEAERGATAAA